MTRNQGADEQGRRPRMRRIAAMVAAGVLLGLPVAAGSASQAAPDFRSECLAGGGTYELSADGSAECTIRV